VAPTQAIKQLLRPAVKRLLFSAVTPTTLTRPIYQAVFKAHWLSRELVEWLERGLIATPALLARASSHGSDITCDRIPYITGSVELELGSQIRFSGRCDIISPRRTPSGRKPVLKIGNGVFIGNGTTFTVADRIEIGDYVAIGAGSSVADTEGHSNYNPNRPIWEVPAAAADVAPVVIEDNVQFGKRVSVLKGVRIGARSIIGAGALVRTNIPADAIVMGNPARVVKIQQAADGASEAIKTS
jgi:acetyltransferase-like isoleucine patch superfamily enzyme